MKCKQCDGKTLTKLTTYVQSYKYRRRECVKCGYRFSTREYSVDEINELGKEKNDERLEQANGEIRKLRRLTEAVETLFALRNIEF